MQRLGMILEFSRAGWLDSHAVALFFAKNPQHHDERFQEFPVEEHIVRQRLTGPEFGQYIPKPLFRFDDCEVSEHDLIRALRACRNLREAGRSRRLPYDSGMLPR